MRTHHSAQIFCWRRGMLRGDKHPSSNPVLCDWPCYRHELQPYDYSDMNCPCFRELDAALWHLLCTRHSYCCVLTLDALRHIHRPAPINCAACSTPLGSQIRRRPTWASRGVARSSSSRPRRARRSCRSQSRRPPPSVACQRAAPAAEPAGVIGRPGKVRARPVKLLILLNLTSKQPLMDKN